jgi:hypothetical protein
MSNPPIQYTGPHVSENVPWDTRVHLQAIYQKLANHTQAFSLQQSQIAAIKPAGSTTAITSGGGGSQVPISLGAVNNQAGATSYTTTQGDDGVVLQLNDASPVAVTLSSAVNPQFYLTVTNFGAGTATLTPSSGNINGVASYSLFLGGMTVVVFDGVNWWATAENPLPSSGLSVTITTAALTVLGSQGSMTFVQGVLTAQTQAT